MSLLVMEGGKSDASLGEFGIDLEGFLEMGSGLVEDRHFKDLVGLRKSYFRLLPVRALAVARVLAVTRVLAGAFFFAGVRFATGFA